MDELLEQFLIEGRDLIAQATRDFSALLRDPQSSAAIDSAFRAMHTLKGSVGLFAMQPAELVLHGAETMLGEARKGTTALDAGHIATLIACLDQTDRWIDEIEEAGELSAQASVIAEGLLVRLAPAGPAFSPDSAGKTSGHVDWLGALRVREADVLAASGQPLTAFRYTPDSECFFRGDDPLAIVAAVPELATLAVLPRDGQWPDAESIEPFACVSILEGLSAAPLEKVSAAFRLMPDQVICASLDPIGEQGLDQAPERRLGENRMLRVDPARVDALGGALGELLVAVNGMAPLAEQAERLDRGLAGQIRAIQADLERVTGSLRRTVSAVRSVELEPTLRRLPRLVREIAEGLGKSVEFTIAGQGIEIDKQIADGLFEPLLHLVRNAVDHGIELPERRAVAGKSPAGTVSLNLGRDGDTVVVQLADDGAGIDIARIKAIAVERGLVSAEETDALTDASARRLIFAPGFSTAATVTQVSGRGVGMDAVQAAVEALRGTIDVESTPGHGTIFRLRLPASTLTTRLLIIEVGGERYGVALDQVVETVGIESSHLRPIGGGIVCVLHGRTVPVLDLASLLGGEARATPQVKLLVTEAGGAPVALRVDGFAQRIDTQVRPRSGMLAAIPGVIGSTLLGDGTVLLVLDLPELAA